MKGRVFEPTASSSRMESHGSGVAADGCRVERLPAVDMSAPPMTPLAGTPPSGPSGEPGSSGSTGTKIGTAIG